MFFKAPHIRSHRAPRSCFPKKVSVQLSSEQSVGDVWIVHCAAGPEESSTSKVQQLQKFSCRNCWVFAAPCNWRQLQWLPVDTLHACRNVKPETSVGNVSLWKRERSALRGCSLSLNTFRWRLKVYLFGTIMNTIRHFCATVYKCYDSLTLLLTLTLKSDFVPVSQFWCSFSTLQRTGTHHVDWWSSIQVHSRWRLRLRGVIRSSHQLRRLSDHAISECCAAREHVLTVIVSYSILWKTSVITWTRRTLDWLHDIHTVVANLCSKICWKPWHLLIY